jgi:hypothetical protein
VSKVKTQYALLTLDILLLVAGLAGIYMDHKNIMPVRAKSVLPMHQRVKSQSSSQRVPGAIHQNDSMGVASVETEENEEVDSQKAGFL